MTLSYNDFMTIIQKPHCDLFSYMGADCYFAHCISRDFALGKGIAVRFRSLYHLTPATLTAGMVDSHISVVQNVFNLITKDKYWQKPTYDSLRRSLLSMKKLILALGVTHLVIPKIGCGLDKLQWRRVYTMLEEVFKDIPTLTITVCSL